ncbi:MAG: tetratricopeptide repeat protein [Gammaproteobacteria bacterium]|nr:tetratricopeptide repeat protein [Gammaproteobacteria bacterium]
MGEAEVVIPVLESMISNIEEHSGLYDEDLVEPWVLLGDANYVLGQHMEALGAYRSASGVSRIVDGPLAPDQRRIAYREGNLLAQLGAWQEANARFEHAYKIVLKQYDDELDPKRIQGLIQLLDWYESTRKFGAALILYDKLREYVTEQYPPANPFALEVRRKYVNALREVRYPTPGTRLAPRFQVRVPGWEPKRFRKGPSVYARGIAELQDISHIVLSNPVASNVERASTLLDLADWHVLFNRAYKGIEYYEAAWELLETTPELLQQAFDKPNIIHMSVTRSWVSPERGVSEKRKVGIVELSLHINNRGKVVGRKTISTFPDTRMEYRVRVIAEHAKYRPSFKNGKPVRTRNVPFIYRYALAR